MFAADPRGMRNRSRSSVGAAVGTAVQELRASRHPTRDSVFCVHTCSGCRVGVGWVQCAPGIQCALSLLRCCVQYEFSPCSSVGPGGWARNQGLGVPTTFYPSFVRRRCTETAMLLCTFLFRSRKWSSDPFRKDPLALFEPSGVRRQQRLTSSPRL